MKRKQLAFLGAGNMAGAIAGGLFVAGLFRPSQVAMSDASAARRRSVKRKFGVEVTADNAELVSAADTVVLAVKPQILPQVLAEIAPVARPDTVFISIAAGVTLDRLLDGLGARARVIRVMPNTPALVGKGMSVLVRGGRATAKDEREALSLFRAVGEAVAVRDEALIDAVTGVSGSGPAYVYLFAEALVAGGVAEGLPEKVATQLAYQTLEGAAAMLRETKLSPLALREMVSSPGGTTVAGLAHLESKHFARTVARTVGVAAARSRQLGKA